MKLILILSLIFSPLFYGSAQTLVAGDLAFIGFNTDDMEGFSIITLNDIPGSSQIYFTDRGVINASSWNPSIESYILFTAPATGISCGTIISFVETSTDVLTINGAPGSSHVLTGSFNLGAGDQIIAFQTSLGGFPSSPSQATFIAGIHSDWDPLTENPITKWTNESDVSSTSESAIPPGLTNGINCLAQNPGGPEVDNAKYSGTLTGTSTSIRSSINNSTNWILSDVAAYPINPSDFPIPSITCVAPCSVPSIPTLTASPTTVCSGNTTTLNFSGTLNDATHWAIYTGSCGGTLLGITATSSFVVTPVDPSTTYFVRGEGGCVTPGTCGNITVNVNSLSTAPTGITGTTTICNGGNTTLTLAGGSAGTGAVARWYTGSCGGTLAGTGNSIVVSPTSTTTYFVRYEGTCNTTTCASTNVTVNSLSTAPTSITGTTTICNGGNTTLTLAGGSAGTGAVARWYTGSCGGTLAGTGNSIVVSPTSTTTYFVRYEGTCNTTTCASTSVTVNNLSTAPTVITGTTTICNGGNTTLTLAGGSAGTGAVARWYTGSCGGTLAGTGNSIVVSPTSTTTYFVRYEGTCNTTTCASTSVTVNAIDNASFNFGSASYCLTQSDPTPTITGLAGGTFSSSPAGLSMNASTGTIDLSASTPNTYTVTYLTAGPCPNSSIVSVSVTTIDNASFNYSAGTYCVNASDPTPTITGVTGGTFSSSPAGLSINSSSGIIDVSASTPNTYTVTYTTPGVCSNSEDVIVTINALDNASFTYSMGTYCVSSSDPTPTITGLAGGTFTSSPAGLSINASTGTIDISASMLGTFSVIYTTSGVCSNTSNTSVTINDYDDATFNYSSSNYCASESDPTPTISGLAGGTFSSSPAGLSINTSIGTIDISASSVGTYSIVYTTSGACPNTFNTSITINEMEDPSFFYGGPYCVDGIDPIPTILGTPGGTFTSFPIGLSMNPSSGVVDLSASSTGSYIVTYTTSGICSNNSNTSVEIYAPDDATFNYSASSYCTSESNPTPTISGLAGGTFSSSPAGLSINISTGQIDLSASTAATYTVTYTTSGICPSTSDVSITVINMDDATFVYSSSNYCLFENNQLPIVTPLVGGEFSSSPSGMIIDPISGEIDLTLSVSGSYTITFTTTGTCPNSSSVSMNINEVDTSVTVSGDLLTSNASDAVYQWIDCDNGNEPIIGETNQTFMATSNGNYAVIVTENGCSDTSACVLLNSVSLDEKDLVNSVKIHPNPASDFIIISTEAQIFQVNVLSLTGKLVESSSELLVDVRELISGVYILNIVTDNGIINKRFVKK